MQMLMDTSGQIYKADAQTYAARYNRLFDIDGNWNKEIIEQSPNQYEIQKIWDNTILPTGADRRPRIKKWIGDLKLIEIHEIYN